MSFRFRSTCQPCLLEFIATRLESDFNAIHIEGQQFYRNPIPAILSLLVEYCEDGWSKTAIYFFPASRQDSTDVMELELELTDGRSPEPQIDPRCHLPSMVR